MQITSSLPSIAEPTSSSTSGGTFNPEDYMTVADIKMLEYVTETSNLSGRGLDAKLSTTF